MKLLFLYGPPASGKLTVANKLSELTKIPLFHNHLSRDIVKDIYGKNLLNHYALVDQIRFDVLSYCANQGTDIIFTYVYEGKTDDENVRKLINAIKNNGGDVVFIELKASREDLIKRVSNDSRKLYKKLIDPEEMTRITEDLSIYSMPFVDSFVINTSELSPEESANFIAAKLNLL